LRKLILNNNSILNISNNLIWSKLISLEILNLHENKINSWATLESLTYLKNIKYLSIYENPIAKALK